MNPSLSGADLQGVDLHGADLTGANLTGADLTGADLTNADLTNADLPSIGGNVEEKQFNGSPQGEPEKQCESSDCPVVLYTGEECPRCGR